MCNISASHKRGKLITQSSRLRPNTFACVSRVCESTSRGGVETLRYSRCRLYFELGLEIYIYVLIPISSWDDWYSPSLRRRTTRFSHFLPLTPDLQIWRNEVHYPHHLRPHSRSRRQCFVQRWLQDPMRLRQQSIGSLSRGMYWPMHCVSLSTRVSFFAELHFAVM